LWAALLFILAGLLLAGWGVSLVLLLAITSAINHTRINEIPGIFNAGLAGLGVLSIIHGFRCLRKPRPDKPL
jgi:hypothetical protein